ncbi:phosphatidate cytidylyltransferase [Tepidimicrobium xylanilyticum]|uniref:Phosphatidate cytidylyltransferase n=1 Tax=Tepidimicrobium xylanilyticum TaxID=1123352 RepID=A0A1H2YC76_9FIRM|nr:phosphatidate cytidylyltransferase [Tepidimicrobium xylanilyticum]GMG97104.1 phosphatidate cytidylyltransferase [Tepidimicrobium xylanilyticum]SDX02832.1 phosphatidate cytidylyltransferase [Tepidimicrobium xylanilyticum]
MRNLIIRTLSGTVLVLLTLSMLYKGGFYTSFYIFILSLIGIREFYAAVNNNGFNPIKEIGYISCIGFLFNSLNIKWITLKSISLLIIIPTIFSLYRKKANVKDVMITILGIIYIPFLFQYIIHLRGSSYLWFVFIIAWGTDTFAYLIGLLFGKTKLCPKISPKKTVEGALGGILGSIFLTIIFVNYFDLSSMGKFILLSVIGSVLAQIGDLTASKIKRKTGIKDFGFIMPGHGGVLDRFDSILFIAPYVYYIVNYFI